MDMDPENSVVQEDKPTMRGIDENTEVESVKASDKEEVDVGKDDTNADSNSKKKLPKKQK